MAEKQFKIQLGKAKPEIVGQATIDALTKTRQIEAYQVEEVPADAPKPKDLAPAKTDDKDKAPKA